MEGLIAGELPDGLCIPTRIRCTTWTQPALARHAERIDVRLVELGWLVTDSQSDVDPWLTVEEAAEALGQSPGTVRRWIREGVLEGRLADGGRIAGGHRVRQSTVTDFAQLELSLIRLTDLSDELGVGYHRLYNWIQRFDLATNRGGDRGMTLPEETAKRLHELFTLERDLQKEGYTFAEAARLLGVQSRTIGARIALGVLMELPTAGPDGIRYVSRESVQRAQLQPQRMTCRPRRGARSSQTESPKGVRR
jgi:excisionase family DNA binding protein